MKKNINSDFNRAISAMFTVPTFKEIFKSGYSDYFVEKINKYRKLIGIRNDTKIKNVVNKTYNYLSLNYRNEYIYKSIIANKLFLERHDLNNATLINEFRIGRSIADVVIINGTNTVYEIKTELDSPDKLKKQIEDYKKISPKVYLVTHHTLINKYADLINKSSVGLISLSQENNFTVVNEALTDSNFLNNTVMLETLRKEEYSSIIQNYFGSIPQVSNIKFYRECQNLIQQIEPEKFHEMMLKKLREREIEEMNLVQSNNVPFELKHICLCSNPNKIEYQNLFNFLNLTI